MRVIIAGGREYQFCKSDYLMISDFIKNGIITEVVSGGCPGADRFGETVAKMENVPVKIFFADWKKFGKAAGPIRNKQMARYADAAILFKGGKGTASMRKMSKEFGLQILYDAGA